MPKKTTVTTVICHARIIDFRLKSNISMSYNISITSTPKMKNLEKAKNVSNTCQKRGKKHAKAPLSYALSSILSTHERRRISVF